jgi:hypothetical protein
MEGEEGGVNFFDAVVVVDVVVVLVEDESIECLGEF